MFFSSLVPVKFGPYSYKSLGLEVKKRGYQRVLLISDRGIEETGYVEELLDLLKREKIEAEVFSKIPSNPHLGSVKEGLLKANSFQPEALVAVGGGSVLDTAKGIGIWYGNQEQELWDLKDPKKREEGMLPVITIPTTAGTGSEVSSWAVITNRTIPEKVSIGGEGMAPILALVDPVLTKSLPRQLTLWTGLDALSHALEAYISKGSNPLVKEISLLAVKRIYQNLPVVLADGNNLVGREDLLLASLLAGLAMENGGLGLIHGMSHQISAYYDYHHGLTNALLMPYVLELNLPFCQEDLLVVGSIFDQKKDLVRGLHSFYKKIGFSQNLDLKEEHLHFLSKQAMQNINTKSNPREVNEKEIVELFRQAFHVK